MYLSDIRTSLDAIRPVELAGARVLITGLSADAGVDLARAFADLSCRMVVQTSELSPEVTELVALLSQDAAELKLFTTDLSEADDAVAFAQRATQAFGGFDVVVNLTAVSASAIGAIVSDEDAETFVTTALAPMAHLTRVVANRMRLVVRQGLIVNVLMMPRPATPHDAAVCALTRATLAAMTAEEARSWADEGIRINAVGPRAFLDVRAPVAGACLVSEPELANLVLHLGSRNGASLSGYVFDCETPVQAATH